MAELPPVRRPEPQWVAHAVWWQIFPMGFTGADVTGQDRAPVRGLSHIIDWLDYVVELGASGILLGPIFASASHGYDTLDYFHIDPRLGTDADFDRLVDAANDRGLRILLDGVFNHVGRDFPSFQQVLTDGRDAPRVDWFHLSWPEDPNSSAAPEYRAFEGHDDLVTLNHENPEVVEFVAEVMNHWLDRGASGWRLDAAYAVPHAFWAQVLPRVRSRHPDAYVLGEVIHGDYIETVTETGLDAVTQYELWKAIWSSLNDRNFFELAWALDRHNEYLDAFVPLTFVGNHDVTRIASKLVEDGHLTHALVLLFTLGGTPSIYYGDEQAFRGIKEERFGGDDDIRPDYPSTPSELAPYGWPTYRLHQDLIGLRRRHPWLHEAHTETLALTNEVLVYATAGSGTRLLVALNIGDQPSEAPVPGDLAVLAGSEDASVADGQLTLGAHGWLIAEQRS